MFHLCGTGSGRKHQSGTNNQHTEQVFHQDFPLDTSDIKVITDNEAGV
jgi:hypothetical protein